MKRFSTADASIWLAKILEHETTRANADKSVLKSWYDENRLEFIIGAYCLKSRSKHVWIF